MCGGMLRYEFRRCDGAPIDRTAYARNFPGASGSRAEAGGGA